MFVASADVDNDGKDDIITGAGSGGGPHVRIFDGDHVLGSAPTLATLGEFMAYSPAFTGGVTVAAADMGGGDAGAEIVTGAGPGGGPHVRVIEPNGVDMAGSGEGFFAFSPAFHGGVNVAADCTDGVPRIGVGTMRDASRFAIFNPDRSQRDAGLEQVPESAGQSGESVALGALSDEQAGQPVQLVTGFSGADDTAQVAIWRNPTSQGPLAEFDAYAVLIRVNVAVAYL